MEVTARTWKAASSLLGGPRSSPLSQTRSGAERQPDTEGPVGLDSGGAASRGGTPRPEAGPTTTGHPSLRRM